MRFIPEPSIPWARSQIREQYLEAFRQLRIKRKYQYISVSQFESIMSRLRLAMKFRWIYADA